LDLGQATVNNLKPGDLVCRRIVGGLMQDIRSKDKRLGLVIQCLKEDPGEVCVVRQLQVQFLDTQKKQWFYEHQLTNAYEKAEEEDNV
jgi:hypothetical protein